MRKCSVCGVLCGISHGTPDGWDSKKDICLSCRLSKIERKLEEDLKC